MESTGTEDMRRLTTRFALSTLLALVILGIGMGWAWRVGLQANSLDHRLDHMQHQIVPDGDHDEEAHR